jgi:hypothetical protein
MMFLMGLIAAEIALGAVVGFVLSDNKKGLSVEEVKISSILFLLSTAFVFYDNPQLSGALFAHLAISWFILIIGVLLGEALKMRLIGKIVRSIQKKDIQLAINELVQIATQTQFTKRESDVKELYAKLYKVQEMLHGLARKSKGIQNQSFLEKVKYLFELCEDYVSLSVKIKGDIQEGKQTDSTLTIWENIGKELTSLSWDTLNHAEENVKNELGKAFSVKVVHKAIGHK